MARHTEKQPDKLTQRELVITRVLDAPREAVWDLCTERAHAMEWWGPKNFTVSAFEMDLRPGGTWRAVIRSPEGQDYPQHGTYELVDRPEHLAFTFVWQREGPGSEMLCTLSLKENGAKTEMTFRKGPFPSVESHNSELDGWNECFDRLEKYPRTYPGRSGAAGLRAQRYSYVNHAVAVAAVAAFNRTQCAAKPSGNRCTTASPAGTSMAAYWCQEPVARKSTSIANLTGRSRSCDSATDFLPKLVIRNGSLVAPASTAVSFHGPPSPTGRAELVEIVDGAEPQPVAGRT